MDESTQTSRLDSLYRAAGPSLAMAVILSLPAAVRVSALGGSALRAALISVGILAALFLPVFLLIPKAARGYRGIAGPSFVHRRTITLVSGLLLVALTVAGLALKARTHHRGLGGATFGVFAAAALVGAWVIIQRGLSFFSSEKSSTKRKAISIGVTAVAIALPLLGLTALAVTEAPSPSGNQLRSILFDVGLVAVAVPLLHPRGTRLPNRLEQAALAVFVALVMMGGQQAVSSASASSLRKAGGLSGSLMGVLHQWTDFDGDGHGAHFGGDDCDEGDPTRYPGAPDEPGDGRDQNCDGVDGVRQRKTALTAAAPSAKPSASVVASTAPSQTPPKASAADPSKPAPSKERLSAPKKPDIILVTLDTVRADRTSVYGYEKKTTPSLKALATTGTVFEYAFSPGSDTKRALMPLVSGKPLSKTPKTKLKWPAIKRSAHTVAERLKEAGYQTAAVSSFTWLRRDLGFHQGFDHFSEKPFRDQHPERMSTGKVAQRTAIKLYDRLSKNSEPLFLWVHLFDAHEKYLTHSGFDFGRSASGRYDGEIAFVDHVLGEVIEHVKNGNRAARTVWMVHGSHGEAFNEHGVSGHGTELYNEQIRVPLVVAGDPIKNGRYTRDAVSTLDIAPTLLDLADADTKGSSGHSLKPIVLGDYTAERPPLTAHAWRRACIVDWPLKLIVFRRGKKKDRLLLFDLENDPLERKDISAERKSDLRRLESMRRKIG